jgi:hypothetical protein
MSRPSPKVLLEHFIKRTQRTHQIVAAEAYYVVLYNEKPFNYKDILSMLNNPSPKYHRNAFPTHAGARNLASRLNKMFFTDKFAAYQVTGFEKVVEPLEGDDDQE